MRARPSADATYDRVPDERDPHANGVEYHFESLALCGAWDGLYDGPESAANVSFRLRLSAALELVPRDASRILDVGCGPAPLAPPLLGRGACYVGSDIVHPMLLRARLRARSARLVRASASLPFREGTFDAVVALGFVEYLPDAPGALREMCRVVRRGGTVVVSTPKPVHLDQVVVRLSTPLRRAAAAIWGRRSDSIRRRLLAPAALDRLAEQAGLRRAGGAHYHFTPLPYPLTVILPGTSLRATRAMEAWRGRGSMTFLAHGYIGRYRRD